MSEGLYWLASYPKSGNTWLRMLLTNYLSGTGEPAKLSQIDFGFQATRRNWLDEWLGFESADLPFELADRYRPAIHQKAADGLEQTTFCKTHELCRRTADGQALFSPEVAAGAILIVRNPLDVAVSLAQFIDVDLDRSIAHLNDEEFTLARQDRWLHDTLPIRVGSWSSHAASWMDSDLRLHLLCYEQLLADPEETFAGVLEFAGLAVEDSRVRRAVEFSSFNQLREQETKTGFAERVLEAPSFFRRGEAGGWREVLNDRQVERVRAKHGALMRRLGYW